MSDTNQKLTLSEFLNISSKDISNIDIIFNFVDVFLNELQQNDFPVNKISIMKTVLEKFTDCGYQIKNQNESLKEILHLTEDLESITTPSQHPGYRSALSIFKNIFNFGLKESFNESYIFNRDRVFNRLYSTFISSYKAIIEERPKIEFAEYYKPHLTNKDRIKFLIKKAKELINEDEFLKSKAKKDLIQQLEEIIKLLDGNQTNWTLVFGKLGQLVFILGALGSIGTFAINALKYDSEGNKIPQVTELVNKAQEEIKTSGLSDNQALLNSFEFSSQFKLKQPSEEIFQLRSPSNTPPTNDPNLEIEDAVIIEEKEEEIFKNHSLTNKKED